MALRKKRGDDGSGIGCVVLALVLVFALVLFSVATILVATWLVTAWLLRELLYRKKIKNPREKIVFTVEEVERLGELIMRHEALKEQESAINERGSHLSRRNDGRFDGRSKLGRELNSQLKPLEIEISLTESKISVIRGRPYERFSVWSGYHTKLMGHRASVVAFWLVWLGFELFNPQWVVQFGNYMLDIFPEMSAAVRVYFDNLDLMYGSLLIATWIALCAYHLGKVTTKELDKNLLESLSTINFLPRLGRS